MPIFTGGGKRVGVPFLGRGYAADFYGPTLPNYPEIGLIGACDPERDRAKTFVAEYGGWLFGGMEEVLADPEVRIVVNLTPTARHYTVNRAALSAGKHVYCEKPMTTNTAEARELASLAAERGLLLCSAPATVFSRSAQTLIWAVRDGVVGTPRLAYASLDMGPLAFMATATGAASVEFPDSDWMERYLGVDRKAAMDLAMLRLGPVTNLELFQYSAPDQRRGMPRNSDWGGHHLAFHVEDMDEAVAYLRAQSGVRILGEPQPLEAGSTRGDSWVYLLSPWGMQLELIRMPPGMSYERETTTRLYQPGGR